jgi:hypothetical protein
MLTSSLKHTFLLHFPATDDAGSTGFCGHVFSIAYELKNDIESGSGKFLKDISVIHEPENA